MPVVPAPRLRVTLVGLMSVALLGVPAAAASAAPPPVVAPAAGVLDPGLPTAGDELQPVVVTGSGALRDAVLHAGGVVRRELPLVGGLSARVPASRLRLLAGRPGVRAVTADRVGAVQGHRYDDSVSASSYAWSSGAASSWGTSRGEGVSVAVLDTGVTPVADLEGRVVSGPDLSGENAPARDSFGHGTVMAGLVAGAGAAGASAPRTGMAPAARVVSVKVAGADGASDVSTVLAAMHWVAAFRKTYGIRVLNLSWGVPSTQDPSVDPLDYAVQRLWSLGITVVVSAGNEGAGKVLKPGDDPLVVTVGAYDDKGDRNVHNDAVPAWSSSGPTAQGIGKPDLVAPGRTLVATRSPGSTVETENPKALVAGGYIKGSGSSQAAAVTSGAAALLLSARPDLTPDQVKAALVRSAVPLKHVAQSVQGAGRLAVDGALTAPVADVGRAPFTAFGTGSLDGSRGSAPRVQVTCSGATRVLDDETTSWCAPWDATSWTATSWTATSWTSAGWDGGAWTRSPWNATSWTATSWTATSWTATSWTATSWTATSWTATSWTSDFQSAFWGDRPPWWHHLDGETNEPRPAACRQSASCE